MYQHFPLQDPPKYTQIWIFGLKKVPSGNPADWPIFRNSFFIYIHTLVSLAKKVEKEKLGHFLGDSFTKSSDMPIFKPALCQLSR
jgi:hypothetical protein